MTMGPKAIGVIFLILALGFMVFIWHSGIVGKLTSGIGSLNSGFSNGSSTSFFPARNYAPSYIPQLSSGIQGGGSGQNLQNLNNYEQPQLPAIATSDVPLGFARGELSPYFHKVRLGSVSAGYYYSGGQVSLYGGYGTDAPIDISGWLLAGNHGSQIVPQAVNVYDPSGLAAESDIYLKGGDTLNIYFSPSAIGLNLRLNKCIGYLQNTNRFVPSLPVSCPAINRSEIANFTGSCQSYILSLGSCSLPASNPPIPYNDFACQNFLNNLNYKGCFDRHSGDADFLDRERRAWVGYVNFLDSYHDRLALLDKQGLLVDLYEY